MALKSILRPDSSIQLGVLIGIVDVFIYSKSVPSLADVRTADPHNEDVETARKHAAWATIAFNSFVSMVTRDWNVFLTGGIVVIALDFMTKHANGVNPATKKLDQGAGNTDVAGQADMNTYPLPDYSMAG